MTKYKFTGTAVTSFRTIGLTVSPGDVIDFGSVSPPAAEPTPDAPTTYDSAADLWSTSTADAVTLLRQWDQGKHSWEPLIVARGTATLVAGTVTVADTKITANSVIRLANKTVGGTAGAVFISAKTAATSFVIKSTSSTDTSTVAYEVVSY